MQDDRVQIVAPSHRETVRLPVILRWEVADAAMADSLETKSVHFGLFVDRSPMPPGEGIDYLIRDDDQCVRDPGCPSRSYLRGLGIYETSESSFTFKSLRDTRPEDREDTKEAHEIIIVLLDQDGNRVGEAAYQVEFFLERGDEA